MFYTLMSSVARGSLNPAGHAHSGPISLPAYRGYYGDSQTDGRETELTAKSPPTIFEIIAADSGIIVPASVIRDGFSGRSLAGSFAAYQGDSFAGNPMIWFQESGNQDLNGQRTAAEWGATFRSIMRAIHSAHPLALLLYETAYSFRRELIPGRNWDPYNDELRASVATLAGEGITVHIVESDANIKALVAELTYDVVCFPDTDVNAYHYQGVGNLMIALSGFDTLGYDVTTLDLSGVTVLEAHKAAAIWVITG